MGAFWVTKEDMKLRAAHKQLADDEKRRHGLNADKKQNALDNRTDKKKK